MNTLISIIIPIYNVEEDIERCARSLFEQSYSQIEYIFVNDATPDSSIKILDAVINEYPDRKNSITLINHAKNLGLGYARRSGYEHSTGEYIIHIDSDDWCEPNMIEDMIAAAKKTDADIILCDYFINFPNKELYSKQIEFKDSPDLFRKILRDEISPVVWNKLVNRNCYKDIKFPNFNLGEDVYLSIQLVKNAHHAYKIPNALIHYNKQNATSITSKKDEYLVHNIKEYTEAVKSLLISWGLLGSLKKDYYTGVLSRVLVLLDGDKVRDTLNKIEPNSLNLYNLWTLQNRNVPKKIIYTLSLLGLGKLSYLIKRTYQFSTKKTN